MNTNGIFIKGCFIGEPINAVLLWEFRRELRLTRRLIKIAEKCIAEKETHVVNSFEGVCFYIARSIIWSSKSAFDNLVLGHFETVEMVIRATIENRVTFDLIFNDEIHSLWKYYIAYSQYQLIKGFNKNPADCKHFIRLREELELPSEFFEKRGDKKPYIELHYGWTYKLETINPKNRFKFKGLCDAVKWSEQNYEDFQGMSGSVHGSPFFQKVTRHASVERIMNLFSCIYINLFQLVTTYCDDIWGDDFDAVTEELESIFDHFVEVYAQA